MFLLIFKKLSNPYILLDFENKKWIPSNILNYLVCFQKSRSDDSDAEDTPIMYPCGICTKEVSDADDAILCEAGCEFWYHRMCTGMTDIAYQYLTNEENCEWVCDKCIATKSVPLVKIKSAETTAVSWEVCLSVGIHLHKVNKRNRTS